MVEKELIKLLQQDLPSYAECVQWSAISFQVANEPFQSPKKVQTILLLMATSKWIHFGFPIIQSPWVLSDQAFERTKKLKSEHNQ